MEDPPVFSAQERPSSPAQWTYWDWDFIKEKLIWDESVAGLLGWSASELAGDPSAWHSRLHPDDRERVFAELARARADAERWSLEYRVLRKDGTIARVLDRGSLLRDQGRAVRGCGSLVVVDGTPRDLADGRRLLPAQWEESEQHFRTFVDWLPQLAWSATPDGWINWYNRRWYDYTGTTLEQMEGWGWVSVHDPDDVLRVLRIIRNAFNAGQPWEDEFRLRRGSDGMLRWHLSRAMPLCDAQGRVVRWFGTNTDVHDQKLAAEAYSRMLVAEQQARREAQSANRAKDEFLAMVSHELRTPLNAILGWTQLLGLRPETLDNRQEVREALARIDANARLQAKLVEDLLDLSRIVAGKLNVELEPVEVVAAIQRALDALGAEAERKGVRLEIERRIPEVFIRGHTDRLQQIAGNLIHNAIKFSPEGASVTVMVERRDDEMVAIVVEDHGEGIAAETLPHIFEQFRQADTTSTRQHGGLGLGLAIVRQLVDLHGGEVTAESEGPGLGARFTVRFPVLKEPESAAGVAPVTAEAPSIVPLSGVHVLLVDDEASAREVVGAMLLAVGATVTRVSSVLEALRAFRLQRPDAVVSDIAMPELDGFALVERIRGLPDRDASRTPCLALTAYASIEDRNRALRLGFDGYLAKPVEAGRLSREVAILVRERLLG